MFSMILVASKWLMMMTAAAAVVRKQISNVISLAVAHVTASLSHGSPPTTPFAPVVLLTCDNLSCRVEVVIVVSPLLFARRYIYCDVYT